MYSTNFVSVLSWQAQFRDSVTELRDCVRKFRDCGAAHRDGIRANPDDGADIQDSRMPPDIAVIAINPNARIT